METKLKNTAKNTSYDFGTIQFDLFIPNKLGSSATKWRKLLAKLPFGSLGHEKLKGPSEYNVTDATQFY